jgi:hypothetical protein
LVILFSVRLLTLCLIALLAGTGIAYFIPTWQRLVVVPGVSLPLTVGTDTNGLGMTIEDRVKNPGQYFIFRQKETDHIVANGQFTTSPNVKVTDPVVSAHGGDVVWTTSSKHETTTHRVPGLHLNIRAAAVPTSASPESKIAEVTWTSPLLQELTRQGNVEVHNGWGKFEGDHVLLARFAVLADEAARKQYILNAAWRAGLPFSISILVVLIPIFLFRSPAGETESIVSGEQVLFPRSFQGPRVFFTCWSVAIVFIVLMVGLMALVDSHLVDLPGALDTCAGLALLALPLLALIGWLVVRLMREVEASPEGVTVRAGYFKRLKFQSAWEEMLPAKHQQQYYKGRIADEWVDLSTPDGRKIRIGKKYVRDFAKMRDFLVRRTAYPATA